MGAVAIGVRRRTISSITYVHFSPIGKSVLFWSNSLAVFERCMADFFGIASFMRRIASFQVLFLPKLFRIVYLTHTFIIQLW